MARDDSAHGAKVATGYEEDAPLFNVPVDSENKCAPGRDGP